MTRAGAVRTCLRVCLLAITVVPFVPLGGGAADAARTALGGGGTPAGPVALPVADAPGVPAPDGSSCPVLSDPTRC